jgi:two-component system response regulator DevR
MKIHVPDPIRLLLVDDHELVRFGLRALFAKIPGIDVVAEAGTAADSLLLASSVKPDVVLMDVRLPDSSGVEACREILALSHGGNIRVLFLTSFPDEDAMLAAVFAGAHGYLLKDISGDALVSAVRTVAGGRSLLDPAAVRALLGRMQSIAQPGAGQRAEELSTQEQRVLSLVAQGKTNKEIAAVMKLSPKTVKNYLSHVFEKMQVKRRSQAAALYAGKPAQN